MIKLWTTKDGSFVYSAEDWSELRKTHHIIGELIGNLNAIPVLPLKLQPEEVQLLIEKGIGTILKNYVFKPSDNNFGVKMLQEQKCLYKTIRKKQLENMIDTILLAKRNKGDDRNDSEIIEEELEKSGNIKPDNMIWPILLQPTEFENDEQSDVMHYSSTLKYMVYKDLWERGYYVTSGDKFGGDFLVYLGDPIAYHAIFIIKCIEYPEKAINSSEIVAFGRLATSVKKKAVLAASIDNIVSYITINWIDA